MNEAVELITLVLAYPTVIPWWKKLFSVVWNVTVQIVTVLQHNIFSWLQTFAVFWTSYSFYGWYPGF
jgi:hypothetical protein